MESRVCRAKFVCQGVTKRKHWNQDKGFLYDATFTPVTTGSEEDKAFWEATPAGSLSLSTIKADFFEPGKSYYLDFIVAE